MRIFDAGRDVRTIGRLLTEAEAEARRGGADRPGPEHLVLAAAALPDGTAAAALALVGVDSQQLRDAIGSVHRDALSAVGVDVGDAAPGTSRLQAPARGALRSTPQAQQVFQDAVALSKTRRPARLRGADVLVAACRLERGTFARALESLGVDREELAAVSEFGAR
ncbi:Clp protease [Nocardioides glacieisoli]|uniref:Clp protease n=1 Tax=Nocardioides glacieisoli TaxID=1168730 RepID=A0A4Q2S4L8_9ACTN|nr:Clp protease N-terminal domain-containing protein [Nocardioides glacieisoli]RYB96750.1 Clp protease [Nocardioides glacieisoli]